MGLASLLLHATGTQVLPEPHHIQGLCFRKGTQDAGRSQAEGTAVAAEAMGEQGKGLYGDCVEYRQPS